MRRGRRERGEAEAAGVSEIKSPLTLFISPHPERKEEVVLEIRKAASFFFQLPCATNTNAIAVAICIPHPAHCNLGAAGKRKKERRGRLSEEESPTTTFFCLLSHM